MLKKDIANLKGEIKTMKNRIKDLEDYKSKIIRLENRIKSLETKLKNKFYARNP